MIGGAVFFVAVLLTAMSQASASTTRPQAETSGKLQGLTWATDLIGQAWHRLVRATVSRFAVAHLVPLVRWFSSLNALVLGVSAAVADVAEETARAFERLTHTTIPREAGKAVQPVKRAAKAAQSTATHASATAHTAAGSVTKLRATVVPRVKTAERAIAVTLPREIAHVNKRVAEVEHTLRFPDRVIARRWAKRLWAAGLAALFIRTLVKRFPWLFCRKVKQVGPRICGMDESLFASLLADTLLIAGTLSLVEFADEMLGVTETAVRPISTFWRAN